MSTKKILKIEFVKNRNTRILSPHASEMLVLNGVAVSGFKNKMKTKLC